MCVGGSRRALRDPAILEKSAAWFARSRSILRLTGEQMAAALGVGLRTWWAWENGESRAPHAAAVAIREMLDERGLDSAGRIRVAS